MSHVLKYLRIIVDPSEKLSEVEQRYVNPKFPWKDTYFKGCTFRRLQTQYISQGQLIKKLPTLKEIRDYVKYQLDNEIREEEQRFENPDEHAVHFTPKMHQIKGDLLYAESKKGI